MRTDPGLEMADAALDQLDADQNSYRPGWEGPDFRMIEETQGSLVSESVALSWGQLTGIACACGLTVLELVQETAWWDTRPRDWDDPSNLYGERPMWSGRDCDPGCEGHRCSCPGWDVFEAENLGGYELQACHECARFMDSDEVMRDDWAQARAGWRGFGLVLGAIMARKGAGN